MRRRMPGAVLVLLLMAAIAATSVGAAGGGAKKALRCATSGHTIAKNRHIRVFRVGDPIYHSTYACVLPSGRVRHLGDYDGDGSTWWDGVYGFVLARNFVAYEDALCDKTACTGSIKSFDVVTREMVHRARIPNDSHRFDVLVANARGSVAWTRGGTVWKCDAPKCVLLDRGPPSRGVYVNPNSLTLQGHTLHWTHDDGTTHSARLK
jgi:hypothetical protein